MIRDRRDKRNFILSGIVLTVLAACFALVSAGPALAQGDGLPAICDQYPNLPECQPLPEGPEDEPGDEGPSANAGGGNGSGDGDGDGSLPFTGYPLTGLVLLILALLVAGLVVRGGLAIRERVARGSASS